MHAIHHTEAIVLKSSTHGEANKRVWLFTREFGLVVATVQGVRKSHAKLMAHTTDYSIIKADLIKGREVWRLISATSIGQPLSGRTREPLARAYVRTLSAVNRFLIEEGVHEELYDHVVECAALVTEEKYEARIVDVLSLWRVFAHLGYSTIEIWDEPLVSLPFAEAYEHITEESYNRLLKDVKHAIEQSHL